MKKSKIKTIKLQRSYEGNYGKMYVYDAVMENTEYGEIQTKTENKYKEGDEIEYELKSREYNNQTIWMIKPLYSSSGGFKTNPDKEKHFIRQSALERSVELCVANKIQYQHILVKAEEFEAWIKR